MQFSGTQRSARVVSKECFYDGTVLDPALVECTFSTVKSLPSVTVTVLK